LDLRGNNMQNIRCRTIREEDLKMLMHWRMMPEITEYMNTNPTLTLEGQKKWYEKIKQNYVKDLNDEDKEFYWILEVDDIPVGFVSFVNWNRSHSIIHTGVYIAVKEKRSIKLVFDLQLSMYEFAFEILKVNKVSMEILGNNINLIKLNERLGAHIDGVMRQEICKEGIYYDLYLLSVLSQEWEFVKNRTKYDKVEFEV
jgi:RimJ/RimL family protein N-acetyltransferase